MTTQPPAIRSQTRKIGKFVKIMAQTFLNCDNMCDLTVLLASICYRKTAARPFDTICDILRALRLVQYLLKGRIAPIWRIGNRGVKLDLLSNLYSKIVNKIWNYRALRGSRARFAFFVKNFRALEPRTTIYIYIYISTQLPRLAFWYWAD